MQFEGFFEEVFFEKDKKFNKIFRATQGDTKSRGMYVTVLQNGVIVDITGSTMKAFITKPDNTRVIEEAVIEDAKFKIEYKNQVFAVPGTADGLLVLYGANGERLASSTFKLLISKSMIEGGIVSKDERGILDKAFELAEDMIPRIELIDIDLLEEVTEQRQQDQLKVAKVEKDITDYKQVMSQVNVNQEAKQKVTGYGVVSLPKNSANGQVSVSVKGSTYTNLLGEKGKGNSTDGWLLKQHITSNGTEIILDSSKAVSGHISANIKSGHKYFLKQDLKTISGTSGIVGVNLCSPTSPIVGSAQPINNTHIFTATEDGDRLNYSIGSYGDRVYHVRNILLVDLTLAGDENLTLQELINKYSYVSNTKSTISASRLKSVGKNLFDGKLKQGYPGSSSSTRAVSFKEFIKLNRDVTYRVSTSANKRHSITITTKDDNNKVVRDLIHLINPGTLSNNISFNLSELENSVSFSFYCIDGDIYPEDFIYTMLEEGTITTPYEPYTESTQYLPNVGELKSLPNGVKDEIRVSGGKAELVKRVSDELVLNGNENWELESIDNADLVFRLPNTNMFSQDRITLRSANGQISFDTDLKTMLWDGITLIYIRILASNLSTQDVVGMKAWLQANPTTLTYQLAEPIITPIEVSGTLLSNPSGTVYVENVVADAGIYGDNLNVLHTYLPIKEVEKVSKVDFTTGVETELDVSQCVIAEDKLSFTHTDLTTGDIVFFTYYHDLESTLGETTIEYYDSRHTLKDDVTGKFYKIVPKISDGVLTNELVEV